MSALLRELQGIMNEVVAAQTKRRNEIQEACRANATESRKLLEKVATEMVDDVATLGRAAAARGRGEHTLTRTSHLKLFLAMYEFRDRAAGTGWTADEILGTIWGLPVRCTNETITFLWWLHPPGDDDLANRLAELKGEGLV